MNDTTHDSIQSSSPPIGAELIKEVWGKSWTYIKTVVDVLREPILVLDKNFRVMAANEAFYGMFQVEPKDTEGKVIYELGNRQWDIPALRKLLEDILPKNTFFKGFEVTHEFPVIGKKIILLNARQIHFSEPDMSRRLPSPIILLAMEDITEMMVIAEMLANHAREVGSKITERTQKLEINMERLERDLKGLKKKL